MLQKIFLFLLFLLTFICVIICTECPNIQCDRNDKVLYKNNYVTGYNKISVIADKNYIISCINVSCVIPNKCTIINGGIGETIVDMELNGVCSVLILQKMNPPDCPEEKCDITTDVVLKEGFIKRYEVINATTTGSSIISCISASCPISNKQNTCKIIKGGIGETEVQLHVNDTLCKYVIMQKDENCPNLLCNLNDEILYKNDNTKHTQLIHVNVTKKNYIISCLKVFCAIPKLNSCKIIKGGLEKTEVQLKVQETCSVLILQKEIHFEECLEHNCDPIRDLTLYKNEHTTPMELISVKAKEDFTISCIKVICPNQPDSNNCKIINGGFGLNEIALFVKDICSVLILQRKTEDPLHFKQCPNSACNMNDPILYKNKYTSPMDIISKTASNNFEISCIKVSCSMIGRQNKCKIINGGVGQKYVQLQVTDVCDVLILQKTSGSLCIGLDFQLIWSLVFVLGLFNYVNN